MVELCARCGSSDVVWANEIRTYKDLVFTAVLCLAPGVRRNEGVFRAKICRACGFTDLYLRDLEFVRSPRGVPPGFLTLANPPAYQPPPGYPAPPPGRPAPTLRAPPPPTGYLNLPPPPFPPMMTPPPRGPPPSSVPLAFTASPAGGMSPAPEAPRSDPSGPAPPEGTAGNPPEDAAGPGTDAVPTGETEIAAAPGPDPSSSDPVEPSPPVQEGGGPKRRASGQGRRKGSRPVPKGNGDEGGPA
jgi:hypothetical protein